ncbi:D-glycerate 2-kinase [Streptomyces sp. L-9-10]|uniref:S1 family peptidase n=1 Tax=Streptomyces sp. L-9-10 TaxID=1478131 RepID=UPI00101DA23C|nr:S1 family peptidase [Streptomyces sp. L-9-10]RYJ31026.1 D-glycerate 2-kinase [Streptomyces sp. L-9-10]
MSHKRIPKRKIAFAGGGAAAVVTAAILLPQANASQDGSDASPAPAPKTLSAVSAGDLASRIAERLGPAFAGAYYDKDRQQVTVNVVGDDKDARAEAARAGAVVRSVKNSTAQLKSAATTLRQQATIPGTAWAVDPRTNQIQVTADRTVTGDKWDRIESTVRSLGADTARIKKSAGEFKTVAAGGDAIFGGGARCSLGFNVIDGNGAPGFLTAGHCGVAADEWSDAAGGAPVGTVQQATFPGDGDFAFVSYDDAATEAPSTVDTGDGQTVEITGAAEATVGQAVIRMGSTTGLNDGSVTGLDATVNYAEGTVTGLIQTDVCAEPGDSGGPLFTADGSAIGLTSGGSGDCTVGGETFFQPVTTALAAVGAQIGDGAAGNDGGGDAAGNDGGAAGNDGGAAGNDDGGAAGNAEGGGEVGNDGGAVGDDGGAAGDGDGAAGNDGGGGAPGHGEGTVGYGEGIVENG